MQTDPIGVVSFLALGFILFGAGVNASTFAARLGFQDQIARLGLFADYLIIALVVWLLHKANVLPAWLTPKPEFFSLDLFLAWLVWAGSFLVLGTLRGLGASHRFSLSEADQRLKLLEERVAELTKCEGHKS